MIRLKDLELYEDENGYLNGKIPYNDVIGFDLTKMNLYFYHVDWPLFDRRVDEGAIKVNVAPKEKPEQRLFNLPNNKKYKSVDIAISEYESLKIRKSNLPGKDDYAILEVHVIPMFEIMGNVNNYSCEELQNRVLQILDILNTDYGLMCENVANLNTVEINVNFTEYLDRDKINFQYYSWLMAPYQYALDPDRFKSDFYHVPQNYVYTPEMYHTGIRSKSETLKINIYDKAFETKDTYNNKKNSQHKIVEMTPLTRLEFGIQKIKQITTYFGKSNLFEVEQTDIETAFMKLFDKYIYEPVLDYQHHMNEEMKIYFSHVDMTDRKWRMNLIKFLAKYRDKTGYLCLDLESISEYVKLIPSRSVKTHAARIRKAVIKEIYDTFKVGEDIWFYNIYNIEILRDRILVDDYGPKEIEFKLAPEYYRMLYLITKNKNYREDVKVKYRKEIKENEPDGKKMKEQYKGLNIKYYRP